MDISRVTKTVILEVNDFPSRLNGIKSGSTRTKVAIFLRKWFLLAFAFGIFITIFKSSSGTYILVVMVMLGRQSTHII
jgi:hypothetical protein